MALITETNAQYYSGQQKFIGDGANQEFTCTFNTNLIETIFNVSNTNFEVSVDGVLLPDPNYSYTLIQPNIVNITPAPGLNSEVIVKLSQPSIYNNYGSYEYISLTDIINNFIVAYVGVDKLIPRVKKSDVIFHAKRGLQEFSYDTLKSIKSQELTIPPSLSLPIPQDYVNYVRCSWIDKVGVQRTIYPTNNLTMSPVQLLIQDNDGIPTQDNLEQNLQAQQSQTEVRWRNSEDPYIQEIDENLTMYSFEWWRQSYGQRYGLEPEYAQSNGWFNINKRNNTFNFSSDLVGNLIILEYISDGLAYDEDMKIPKMAEQAMYMHIAYSILSTRSNIPEHIVHRFKKDRSSQLRNAKIRLQNLKLDEIVQVFRGKSKWIKH